MADFGDPYAATATNPYLPMTQAPDWKSLLANALIGAGASISQADASGRGWASGIAPGLMMGTQMNARDAASDFQRRLGLANWQTTESYLKSQEKNRAEAELKRQELDLDKQAMAMIPGMSVPGAATAAAPGFDVQPPAVQMGPNQFNVGNVRPVGSNVGFQQPASFDDGVALSVRNAQAYPKAYNQGQPMTLLQMGERWAPKGDGANDPVQWAKNVASIGGLPVDQPLDFNDPQISARFARGVHGAEWGAMIDALDGAVERSLPKDMVKDWRDARTSWRRISMIDDAVSSRHNGETAVGNIPPGSLDARAGNDKDMARLAQVGVKFVGDKTPDSSTPAQLFFQNAMGLGAGAGGMYAFPSSTAALVGSGYLANALLNNPYTRSALISRLQRPREGVMSLPLAGVLAGQQGANDDR